MKNPYLFLDFDGVICDSLEECYNSSYLAYTNVQIGFEYPGHGPKDAEYKASFRACRPFVRSGEDYVVLHQLLNNGTIPDSQGVFDEELKKIGLSSLKELKARLYSVREALLVHHSALWMTWNPLYEGMKDALFGISSNSRSYILSTKKSEFIISILAHNGITWPSERVLEAHTQRKLDIITQIAGTESSVFIDDQIDHLDFNALECKCFLALWGYVNKDLVSDKTPSLSLREAVKMMSEWSRDF